MIDTWLQDVPVCPYCGHKETYWADYGLSVEQPEVITCDTCNKEFVVTLKIRRYFTSRAILDIDNNK